MEDLWQQAEAQLLEFDAACREAGCPWFLLIAPSEIQVNPEVQASVLKKALYPAEAYDFETPMRRLQDIADRNGLQLASPLNALHDAHTAGMRQYIPNNPHWNVPGNRSIADFVADQIKTENR